jgi:hypothetical protein
LEAIEAGALFVVMAVAIGELIGLAAKLSITGAPFEYCEKPQDDDIRFQEEAPPDLSLFEINQSRGLCELFAVGDRVAL